MNDLISIILPVYNGEKFIEEAINSTLSQTYKQFELIIVNDCSTDNTLDIVKRISLKDKRIILISNKTNQKLPASLNIGHKKAKGKFVTWTSDDNVLLPNFLEDLVYQIIKQNVDVVYSNYEVINQIGDVKRKHKAGEIEHILFGNQIGASFLYRKEVYDELGGYDDSLFLLEDYDFWLRASIKHKFYHLNKVLYKYRLHSDSLTSNIYSNQFVKDNHQKAVVKMFKKISNQLLWKTETLDFLVANFLNQNNLVAIYLNNKKLIDGDIFRFNLIFFNLSKQQYGLHLLLRQHLTSKKENRNIKTLINVFKKDRTLLVHSNFSKKNTLNYLLKSISNL
ncbi:glycosyltransferase [Flavobacteriaceae bacterium MHTCC 0001]